MAVVDVLGGELGSGRESGCGIFDSVMLFKPGLQPAKDLHGLLHRRLVDIDFLEPARERVIFFEDAAVFGVRRCANALQLPRRQSGLKQVRRIESPARCGARTNERVNLVDKQHRVRIGLELLEDGLEALLKIPPIFGAGQKRPHVQREHNGLGQHVGHIFLGDPPGQPLGDRGLANPRFANQQRIILSPPAKHLNHPLHLSLTPDQGVDPPFLSLNIQVGGVLVKRTRLLRRLCIRFGLSGFFATRGFLGLRCLGDPVADEIDHVEPGNPLLMQVVHRVGILFPKDRHQHIRARHFLLAVRGALNMHDRALDDPLKPQSGLRVDLLCPGNNRRIFPDELRQILAQIV